MRKNLWAAARPAGNSRSVLFPQFKCISGLSHVTGQVAPLSKFSPNCSFFPKKRPYYSQRNFRITVGGLTMPVSLRTASSGRLYTSTGFILRAGGSLGFYSFQPQFNFLSQPTLKWKPVWQSIQLRFHASGITLMSLRSQPITLMPPITCHI